MELTEVQKSYFAGIFDGEGCITCMQNAGNPNPVVTITSQCKELVDKFQGAFGGRTYVYDQPSNNKLQYRWTMSGGSILPFLLIVRPYCIVKREQIKIGILLVDTLSVKGAHIPPEKLEQRHRLWALLSSINGKKKEGKICSSASYVPLQV